MCDNSNRLVVCTSNKSNGLGFTHWESYLLHDCVVGEGEEERERREGEI